MRGRGDVCMRGRVSGRSSLHIPSLRPEGAHDRQESAEKTGTWMKDRGLQGRQERTTDRDLNERRRVFRYLYINYGSSQIYTDLVYRDNGYGGVFSRDFYHMAACPAL